MEDVAAAAAEPLRQSPVSPSSGERAAQHRVFRQVVVEPGRDAESICAEIMGSTAGWIAPV
jgi:hypothetical protein